MKNMTEFERREADCEVSYRLGMIDNDEFSDKQRTYYRR